MLAAFNARKTRREGNSVSQFQTWVASAREEASEALKKRNNRSKVYFLSYCNEVLILPELAGAGS